MAGAVDQKYYQAVRSHGLGEKILIKARARIYADFLRQMRPAETDTILDVGVSDVINDGANVLEREYPHLHQITACGLSDAPEFSSRFPQCRYVKIAPNAPLPFPDHAFAIATSNAVLEHVGSRAHQTAFIGELLRVALRVFISVPNRYFPVEHHTAIPFLHYTDPTFRLACKLTRRSEWTRQENLILMSRAGLEHLAGTTGRQYVTGYTGVRLGFFSSNIFVTMHNTPRVAA